MTENEYTDNIKQLARQIVDLMKEKYRLTREEVETILSSGSRDTNRMEHALDNLLECIEFGMDEDEFFSVIT